MEYKKRGEEGGRSGGPDEHLNLFNEKRKEENENGGRGERIARSSIFGPIDDHNSKKRIFRTLGLV